MKRQAGLQRYANPGESTMKAAVFDRYSMEHREVKCAEVSMPPDPETTPGWEDSVLVKVKSSSVNPVDYKMHQGQASLLLNSNFPKYVGRDASGEVVKCGKNVTNVKVGDEVYGLIEDFGGANAEYVLCNAQCFAKKPKNLTHNEAAGFPLVTLTAWNCLVDYGGLNKESNVLILGGSSGVGYVAVQLAKALGAKMIAATAGPSNIEFVKGLGADYVVDYRSEKIDEVLKDHKFDVVLDAVGSKVDRDRAFSLMNRNGRVITTNPAEEHDPSSNAVKLLKVAGDMLYKNVVNYWNNRVIYRTMLVWDRQGAVLEKVAQMIESEKIKPVIDSVFPLVDIGKAHEKMASGRCKGKVIIEIS